MSADNVIYIKKIEDEYNVWEQSASIDICASGRTLRKYEKELDACKYAFVLQEDWQTEYGVNKLEEDK